MLISHPMKYVFYFVYKNITGFIYSLLHGIAVFIGIIHPIASKASTDQCRCLINPGLHRITGITMAYRLTIDTKCFTVGGICSKARNSSVDVPTKYYQTKILIDCKYRLKVGNIRYL